MLLSLFGRQPCQYKKRFGGELSEEEFKKFTLYTTQSNNFEDDNTRAQILGFQNEGVRIAPGAIVRIGDNQIAKNSYVGLYSYINGDVSIGENVLIGHTFLSCIQPSI